MLGPHRVRVLTRSLAIGLCLLATSAQAAEGERENISLQGYKPIYALFGRPNAKIQFSFKARIIEDLPVYFGYTQLMMWDLFKPSAPFRDLNYNPELFYRLRFDGLPLGSWFDLGAVEHESNGRDKSESRGWNRSYLRYHSLIPTEGRLKIFWELKAWVPYGTVNNPDLPKYRGIWELIVTFSGLLGPFLDPNELTLRIYGGGESYVNPLRGGQELTLRMKARDRAWLPLAVFQLFHGYGENLLDYREKRIGLRAGIGF